MSYSDLLYSLTGIAHVVDLVLFSHSLADRTLSLQKQNRELQNENKTLTNLSNKDGLTGIYNRHYFDNIIHNSFEDKKRNKLPISLIMIDIDNFKTYNDEYGHQAGDNCIIKVAQAINKELKRASDTVARYGGEGFVVVINSDIYTAEIIAKRIETAVRNLEIMHTKSPYKIVTVSQGISTITQEQIISVKELISRADQALYTSKERGKNRYTIWSS